MLRSAIITLCETSNTDGHIILETFIFDMLKDAKFISNATLDNARTERSEHQRRILVVTRDVKVLEELRVAITALLTKGMSVVAELLDAILDVALVLQRVDCNTSSLQRYGGVEAL